MRGEADVINCQIDIADVSIQDYKDRLGNQRGPLCYETSLYVLDCYSVSPQSQCYFHTRLHAEIP